MKLNQEIQRGRVRNAANICIECGQKLTAQIKAVKEGFGAEWRQTLAVPDRLFRLALNEAEALAWQTGYPHLLFPAPGNGKDSSRHRMERPAKTFASKKFGRVMSN
jgi:hypothetical protein